jgi:hypothetical protein
MKTCARDTHRDGATGCASRDDWRGRPTARRRDWGVEAARMADHVARRMSEVRRGAIPWSHPGVAVIFGNDGRAADRRAGDTVAAVRQALQERGIKILGFGVDSAGGSSWAMLVRGADPDALHQLVWYCAATATTRAAAPARLGLR